MVTSGKVHASPEIGRNKGFFRGFGLLAAMCAWVRNYFRPYSSIFACAIEVQHNNENRTTIAFASNVDSLIPPVPQSNMRLCICPVIDHEFRHNIVKVVWIHRLLWQCYGETRGQ